MPLSRRHVLGAALAAPAIASLGRAGPAQAATLLRISHQFPGGTADKGDFRDRLCRRFAAEVERRTSGAITFQIHPGSSLMRTTAQFAALRKGGLDLSVYPLAYAGGEVPETNIGLLPGLISTYEQAARWKDSDLGRRLTAILAEKGVVILTWVWQAGGIASRPRALVTPEQAKGLRVRGGSRGVDLMMAAAGADPLNHPSNDSFQAMETDAIDAVVTSSTSLISFQLDRLAKHLTSGRERSFWFMLQPLIMSKQVFDRLPKDQQDVLVRVGAELESFGASSARQDDAEVEAVFARAGAQVLQMDEPTFNRWRDLARDTAWKDFAGKSASCADLLKLAEGLA